MTTPMRSHYFVPPSTARSSLPKALQRWRLRASGVQHLCTGTTWSTNTAASVMSRPSSAIPVKTMEFLPPVMRCTPRRRKAIRNAGQGKLATGSPSGPLRSIRNVTPSSQSTRRLTLFSSWLHE